MRDQKALILRDIVAAFCVLSPIILIVIFVVYSDRGFDITDESYYLIHAWRPADYKSSVSEFGRYLNIPLSMGGGIASLRIAGLTLLTLVSAFFIFHTVTLTTKIFRVTLTRAELTSIIGAFSLAGLCFYRNWLITPSYNLFSAMSAIIVASAGAMVLRSRLKESSGFTFYSIWIGAVLGFGGFVGLVGRPTTALALGIVAALWFVVVAPVRQLIEIATTAVAVFLAFVVFHIWHFYGSVSNIVTRLEFARELAAALGVGHTFGSSLYRVCLSLVSIPLFRIWPPFFFALLAIAASIAWLMRSEKSHDPESHYSHWRHIYACFGILSAAVYTCAWMWIRSGEWAGDMPGPYGISIVLYIIFLIAGAVAVERFMLHRQFITPVITQPSLKIIISFVILMFLSTLAHTVGSTSDLVDGSGSTFILWFAAAVTLGFLLMPGDLITHRIFMLAVMNSCVAGVLTTAVLRPYRLEGSVFKQTEYATLWFDNSRVRVDRNTADWVTNLQNAAMQNGWQKGLPLIDLTGGSPGASLVLAAEPPTATWLVGGYSGSDDYVIKALQRTDKAVLDRAWILSAEDGVRKISDTVLSAVGLAFPGQYERVVMVRSGYRHERQILWKPKKQEQR